MPGDSGSPLLLLNGEDATSSGFTPLSNKALNQEWATGQKQQEASRQVLLQRLLHPRQPRTPDANRTRTFAANGAAASSKAPVANFISDTLLDVRNHSRSIGWGLIPSFCNEYRCVRLGCFPFILNAAPKRGKFLKRRCGQASARNGLSTARLCGRQRKRAGTDRSE
jgi:hypothetical protein